MADTLLPIGMNSIVDVKRFSGSPTGSLVADANPGPDAVAHLAARVNSPPSQFSSTDSTSFVSTSKVWRMDAGEDKTPSGGTPPRPRAVSDTSLLSTDVIDVTAKGGGITVQTREARKSRHGLARSPQTKRPSLPPDGYKANPSQPYLVKEGSGSRLFAALDSHDVLFTCSSIFCSCSAQRAACSSTVR